MSSFRLSYSTQSFIAAHQTFLQCVLDQLLIVRVKSSSELLYKFFATFSSFLEWAQVLFSIASAKGCKQHFHNLFLVILVYYLMTKIIFDTHHLYNGHTA
jgi:hypothetical protein